MTKMIFSALSPNKSFSLSVYALILLYFAYVATGNEIPVSYLFPSTNCTTSESGSSLKVVHKFGPCTNASKELNLTQLLLQDNSRVDSIQAKFLTSVNTTADESSSLPASLGFNLGTSNYLVTVGLGTPKKDFTLVFDTGSDLTWTQCLPCVVSCYSQAEPIFNPTLSSTYSNVSCTSSLCSLIASDTGNALRCSGTTCVYGQQYGDGSVTIGFVATDTLTLTPTDIFDNFLFGCGQDNEGLFGSAAGLLGLGRDSISIVQQTAAKYGTYFSYCLPPSTNSVGHLTFGRSSIVSTVTPILTIPQLPSLYGIGIVGISVGGTPLSLPSTLFSDSGAIIDSGTVITRLPLTAYLALRDTFRQWMVGYPRAPDLSIMDTCYDLTGYTSFTYPDIVFSFTGGVDLHLDPNGVFFIASVSQICLGFAPNSDDSSLTIYGNLQQRTFEVVYDVVGGRIGFGSKAC